MVQLDIGGEKGNIFYIMGTVATLTGMNTKLTDSIVGEMRNSLSYEEALEVYKKHFPRVQLYSYVGLGLSEEIYTLRERGDTFDL